MIHVGDRLQYIVLVYLSEVQCRATPLNHANVWVSQTMEAGNFPREKGQRVAVSREYKYNVP